MEQGFDWGEILLNWGPMLLLIAVWIYFLRRMGYGKGDYATQYQKDHMAETKRQSEALERIAAALEKNGNK